MSKRTIAAGIAALAILVGGTGCETSHVDKHWGEAIAAAKHRQTADIEGSLANADAPGPQGLDGPSAASVMKKHRELGDKAVQAAPASPVTDMYR